MFFSVIAVSVILVISEKSKQPELSEEELSKIVEEESNQSNAQSLPPPEFTLPEGDVAELQIIDLVEGSGDEVNPNATVKVHYHGVRASDGFVFDSSYEKGEPIEFPLNGVIAGWQEGIPGMKVGGKRQLNIPSDKAYGEQGAGEDIPPNTDLVFVVELLEIK
ncbi:FKBP-type peptidyl-prolyl cis-trans isomerase [Candidatus Saccharibacteria bacterium CPR2]|nr:FKBP-type peptidyl-prolyl cis-trans isomerase [Candidatus Saccharibacteria bacterium CPR2]